MPTNTQVTRSGLIDKEAMGSKQEKDAKGMNTCGTGFFTEKVSRRDQNEDMGLIECKENIILSELSSKKNLELVK